MVRTEHHEGRLKVTREYVIRLKNKLIARDQDLEQAKTKARNVMRMSYKTFDGFDTSAIDK